jgi:isopentenyl-diphosphate Delta-isomerase
VPSSDIRGRKLEHLEVAAGAGVEAGRGPGWEDVELVHAALPRIDLAAVSLETAFLGRALRAPLVIASMTGGHPATHRVNAVLAGAAERHGLAMGVGSQRAALWDPSLAGTYTIAREAAPGAFLIANLGAPQLVAQGEEAPVSADDVRRVVDMIEADALAVHLNFLEEAVQTGGDRQVAGLREALAAAARESPVPAIAKETGAGLSRESALELASLGFAALDVGGRGGTTFAAVEAKRAERHGDPRGARVGHVYRDWGIPTAASIVGASAAGLPMIATGGVRTGLDAARALALGASLVGVARPLVQAALDGPEAVDAWIVQFLDELRVAVFLSGSVTVEDLRRVPRVILGDTRRWLEDLGY